MNKKVFGMVLLSLVLFMFTACGDSEEQTSSEPVNVDQSSSVSFDNRSDKERVRDAFKDYHLKKEGFIKNPASPLKLLDSNAEIIRHKGEYPLSHVTYKNFFLKDGEKQKTTGRYADESKDGKYNWKKGEYDVLQGGPEVLDMFKTISINGQIVDFPVDLETINPDLAVFKDVNFENITPSSLPLVIEDSRNGNKLIGLYDVQDNKIDYSFVDKKYNFIMSFDFDSNETKIDQILTESSDKGEEGESQVVIAPMDIRVDGIGAGSTCNEVYEKFGTPSMVVTEENGNIPILAYNYIDQNARKHYFIMFSHYEKVYDSVSKKERAVKNNLITNVSVSVSDLSD